MTYFLDDTSFERGFHIGGRAFGWNGLYCLLKHDELYYFGVVIYYEIFLWYSCGVIYYIFEDISLAIIVYLGECFFRHTNRHFLFIISNRNIIDKDDDEHIILEAITS